MNNPTITLRPWKMSDLQNLVKYANNLNVAKNLTDGFPHPYTDSHGLTFIANANKSQPTCIFAIEVNGQAVGSIGIHLQNDIHRNNAELGYWLAEPYWGQGIISEAIRQIIDYSFATFQINRIFAKPFGTNAASHKALKKNKFVCEAKFEQVLLKDNEMLDEYVCAIRRQEWKNK